MAEPMVSKRSCPRRAQARLAAGVLLSSTLLLSSCSGGGPETDPRRLRLSASPSTETVDDLYRFFAIVFSAAPGLTYLQQVMSTLEGGASVRQIVRTVCDRAKRGMAWE